MYTTTKKSQFKTDSFLLLSYLDSNQDKQNQNLLCYHYTIGQSLLCSLLKSGAKVCIKSVITKLFRLFLLACAMWCLFRDFQILNELTASITLCTSLSLIAGWQGKLNSSLCMRSVMGNSRWLNSFNASCLCGGTG